MNMTTTKTRNADDELLSYYMKDINSIPLLTREEEFELAVKAKNGDKAAKDKIVKSNLRFVISIAKKYQHQGLDLSDLISEGNIGLITAIDKFDPHKGYHFISYAVWWIRQSILRAIYEKSRAIYLPANKINELCQINKAKKSISADLTDEQSVREIAELLNMDSSYIKELLMISRDTVSLDAPAKADESSAVVADFIEDKNSDYPEKEAIYNNMKEDINDVISTLSEREAKILRYRYGLNGLKSMSLKEIGAQLNLTTERIRQIEKRAIAKMQQMSRRDRLAAYVA